MGEQRQRVPMLKGKLYNSCCSPFLFTYSIIITTNFRVSNELRLIESNGDLDVDTFALFSRNHKAMLFPAFLVQSQLQKKILGIDF